MSFFVSEFSIQDLCNFLINRHISPVAAVTEDTISEKLQEQESRQAELNHYVKMVNSLVR